MNNGDKIILDLCGGTGAWSKPYKDAGYTVHNITLPQYDLCHVQIWEGHDFILFPELDWKKKLSIETRRVHGILAAPTCTMFSLARTTAKTPRDLRGGMKLVDKCLEIIRECRYSGGLKFWALENPVGYLRQILGKPPLTFQPCDYGDNYTKKTDLWGYFNMPKINKRDLTPEEKARCSINNRELPELPPDYVLPENFRPQQARRSMTSSYFAKAFFNANK